MNDETGFWVKFIIHPQGKLRVSLKQIKEILNNQNALAAVEIFERNISELDKEITSLPTIKSILTRFAEELRAKASMVFAISYKIHKQRFILC